MMKTHHDLYMNNAGKIKGMQLTFALTRFTGSVNQLVYVPKGN